MKTRIFIINIFITLLLYYLITLLLSPFPVQAASSSSSHYQLEGMIDYGGGSGTSDNYAIHGIITDANQLLFWPEETAISPGEKTTPPETPIPPTAPEPTSSPAPTETKSIGEIIPEQIATIAETITELITPIANNQIVQSSNLPLVTTTSLLTAWVAAAAPILVNLQLLSPFSYLWAAFLSLFGLGKRRKSWGIVYDTETHQPISLAVVRIFDQEYNRLLGTQITDKDGRFGFLIKPGEYYLQVIKKNYSFPSKIGRLDYHGETVKITSSQIIGFNIPLDPEIKTLARRINLVYNLTNFLEIIRIPVMIIGTCLALGIYFLYPQYQNLLVIIIYFLVWIWELYQLRKAKSTGYVFDNLDKHPLDLAINRAFDSNNKLISTKVSDHQGRFMMLLDPGQYYLTTLRQGYNLYKSNNIHFKKHALIDIKIPLNKG